ncbi:aspartate kinase [Carnobacterium divergens]|uniref:Aspartokinase n=2 Tax=Carnobacterium divergens TaxID=2748 RepID=A0A0R2I7J0_CARDV|nr:aspartate kinase [Carnobacterium divergens]KRN57812.1 aspartate kinase [Carnobacterium divergens DSM 20623]MDO0874443.1 aspartate kinase [Carnobacterium divergens]MDT1958755.1 aspartate kinase [Carnobacterium divergens]MDT1974723.1 aspartate kinase [Carnobacterium divergens]MDT2012476.1 aspartate kinase [Carnobacterium divergens]
MKVIKFGGSSLASATQLKKVFQIVKEDSQRKVVVVSAPGKRSKADDKVTDLLIDCGTKALLNEAYQPVLVKIIARYEEMAVDLNLDLAIIDEIKRDLETLALGDKSQPDYFLDAFKASGENNNAKLIAAYFNHEGLEATYVNPMEAGLFVTDEPGNAQVLPESYERLYELRKQAGVLIVPGFFGYTKEGKLITFSRGGSDITGAILANGLQAELYENFTDVDAIYAANPNVVDKPQEIETLTYKEMRELSYAGFSVFHDEALYPAFKAGVPVQIKNTNNPHAVGTRIATTREKSPGAVVGIASSPGFSSIYIEKYLMNREIGFGRKMLEILEDAGLSYEHTPSGIDDLTVILRSNQLSESQENELLNRLKEDLHADKVVIQHNLALMMVVGEEMRCNVGTMAKASEALAEHGINIEMINQGSSEVSMMFGVQEVDEDKALKALYQAFFN